MRIASTSETAAAAVAEPDNRTVRADDEQVALWAVVFRTRFWAILGIGLSALAFPSTGPDRLWVALAVIGFLLPYNALLRRDTARRRRLPTALFYGDMLVIGLVGVIEPGTWVACLVVVVADVGLASVVLGLRPAWKTFGLALGGLTLAMVVNGPDGILDLAALVVCCPVLVFSISALTKRELAARERYSDLVDGLDAIVWESTMGDPGPSFVSRRAGTMLGHPAATWTTSLEAWAEIVHPEDREQVLETRIAAMEAGLDHTLEYRVLHGAGYPVWVREMVRFAPDEDNDRQRISGELIYVTAEKEAELALRESAALDVLTGLPNRAHLVEKVDAALHEALLSSEPVALVIMDLDQFKDVNETLGHDLGDRLLALVGRRLAAATRDGDTVARLGGDEFALLLHGAGRADVDGFLARLHRVLAEPFELAGIPLRVTASMGVALAPDHGFDTQTMLRRADIAMYAAKRSSRGHTFYDADQDSSSTRRLALVGELYQAIHGGDELILHFQPKIDVATNTVTGAEALVRWQHPKHGLLPPGEFIEIATATGMIQRLTERVLELGLAECRRWADGGLDLTIAVNLSVLNLYDPATTELIERLLIQHGLPGDRLVVEVTESDVMEDPERAVARLRELSELGVRVSIDDFGTGYSSLSHLKQLPIHELKIDRSFVTDMATDVGDALIVRTIIDLSHNLGLDVVAEGVEDQESLNRLAILGCDRAQGFHMGRPLPGPQLDGWLHAWINRHPVLPSAVTDPGR